tara:strand:+ start:899 stop:1078 length:180 start_codon:yes stop_codon:yes gene_type:complete
MDKLLEHFGSQYQIAKRLHVSRAYVCQWFAAGKVPPLMAVKIEKITDGKFKAVDLVEGK